LSERDDKRASAVFFQRHQIGLFDPLLAASIVLRPRRPGHYRTAAGEAGPRNRKTSTITTA
ncbi:MAG: hypothetical protein E7E29_04340, partial [Pseudomonas aeruginosa]|nr:hypothetical protein [Pseudomonas aeruginosa]